MRHTEFPDQPLQAVIFQGSEGRGKNKAVKIEGVARGLQLPHALFICTYIAVGLPMGKRNANDNQR
jgi:hypothetical protein